MESIYHCKIAIANMKGGPLAPGIRGTVIFNDVSGGTVVYANISGLPNYKPSDVNSLPVGPHGFHLHQKGNCIVVDYSEPFEEAGDHWNPTNQPHGNHAGDLSVLFSNKEIADMCFFTNKFKVKDIIGLSVIIHENPDDYQPSGNAGRKTSVWCYKVL